jgi:hypothetical protein
VRGREEGASCAAISWEVHWVENVLVESDVDASCSLGDVLLGSDDVAGECSSSILAVLWWRKYLMF